VVAVLPAPPCPLAIGRAWRGVRVFRPLASYVAIRPRPLTVYPVPGIGWLGITVILDSYRLPLIANTFGWFRTATTTRAFWLLFNDVTVLRLPQHIANTRRYTPGPLPDWFRARYGTWL